MSIKLLSKSAQHSPNYPLIAENPIKCIALITPIIIVHSMHRSHREYIVKLL